MIGKCPKCNGKFTFDKEEKYVQCPFCSLILKNSYGLLVFCKDSDD